MKAGERARTVDIQLGKRNVFASNRALGVSVGRADRVLEFMHLVRMKRQDPMLDNVS